MNKQEKKVLQSLLNQFRDNKKPIYYQPYFLYIEFIVLVSTLVVAKSLLTSKSVNPWVGIVLILLVGVAIGFGALLRTSYKHRVYIKPYLKLDEVEKKLSENA